MNYFDLVIISNGLEGRYAAKKAVNLKYGVALVELPFKSHLPDNERVFIEGLSYFAKLKNDFENNGEIGFNLNQNLTLNPEYNQILVYIKEVFASLENEYSLAILSALGVDVIQENGDFCKFPNLGFITETRQLFAKKYLIATGSYSSLPILDDFNHFSYLTLTNLFDQEKLTSLSDKVTIFTEDPRGIELAYSLAILGKEITLICPYQNLLPSEDVSISHYIQSMLEAKGIKIITHSKITQIKKIDQQIWIQAGDQAIEINDLIYMGKTKSNIESLNLEGVKVKYNNQGIIVNQKLQTTNNNIYACGSVIGGYNNFNISQEEGKIFIKNIKSNFLFSTKINYNYLPYQILSYPCLMRVGLTEKQARNYDQNITIMEEYNTKILNNKITDKPIDYFKIILSKRKEILGVHIIGENADQLINIFALAMEKKIKFDQLSFLKIGDFIYT